MPGDLETNMKKISARRPAPADCKPAPAAMRTLEAAELEQVAAAGSKPGGTGEGRG
jgi:hypothetical protein